MNAFVHRCPTIGYCQGWNSIAARLLLVCPEEEAFWILVQIVEVILPLDYYSNLVGVCIDIKVFQALLEQRLPKLCKHLELFNFNIDMLITKWFICLFVNHLPLECELAVWDLFFIKGSSLLFSVGLTLFQLMQSDILRCQDDGDVFMFMKDVGKAVSLSQLL